MQTVQPIFFVPAMFISTIDFYHVMPLSVTLALAGGPRSKESNTCWLHFELNGRKFGVVMKRLRVNILILLLSDVFIING